MTLADTRIIDLLGGIAILAVLFVALSRWGRRHRSTRSTAAHRARSFLLSALFNSNRGRFLSHLGVVFNEEPELRKRFGESYEAADGPPLGATRAW